MPKHNRVCHSCGDTYYACAACIGINSWKNVCCSVGCYRKMFAQKIYDPDPIETNKGEVNNMFLIDTSGNKKEVSGYDIPLGRIDTTDGMTYTKENIDYLEITLDELQEVAEYNGKW